GLPAGLVLVHGIAARGKDDPLIQRGAALLARAGWAVAVPTVPGLTVLRLRPEDADAVVLAASALLDAGYHPAALLAISLGAGPAISAAAAPELAPHVSAVLAVGGYASSRELLRYTLTGAFAFAGVSGRRAVSEAGIREFAAANRDLMGAEGRALVANRDPARVDALVAGLPGDTRSLLDALSPELAVTRVRAPLFLIHGRQDAVVPYTESLRLERAARTAGRRARVAVVGAVGHVDPAEQASWAELARCWAAFYAFRVTAAASR
ncbi:MAG TPA: hypothetical protein VKD47_00575, partial [Miltoncostaeaceae bacterium]|nr:hypothetical protein [Miltoncostaeaceae bacterium]